jgi:serine/threonine-protein kinase RsbW
MHDAISGEEPVRLRIPPNAGYLSLFRTVVSGCAGREDFTLDQVDDLRMATDEAAVQLLRHTTGDALCLLVRVTEEALEVRVSAETEEAARVIDRESFSWTILQALSDDLEVDGEGRRTVITLRKQRLVEMRGEEQA